MKILQGSIASPRLAQISLDLGEDRGAEDGLTQVRGSLVGFLATTYAILNTYHSPIHVQVIHVMISFRYRHRCPY